MHPHLKPATRWTKVRVDSNYTGKEDRPSPTPSAGSVCDYSFNDHLLLLNLVIDLYYTLTRAFTRSEVLADLNSRCLRTSGRSQNSKTIKHRYMDSENNDFTTAGRAPVNRTFLPVEHPEAKKHHSNLPEVHVPGFGLISSSLLMCEQSDAFA